MLRELRTGNVSAPHAPLHCCNDFGTRRSVATSTNGEDYELSPYSPCQRSCKGVGIGPSWQTAVVWKYEYIGPDVGTASDETVEPDLIDIACYEEAWRIARPNAHDRRHRVRCQPSSVTCETVRSPDGQFLGRSEHLQTTPTGCQLAWMDTIQLKEELGTPRFRVGHDRAEILP